jgi:cytochrome c-type biogenesis protein CcmF
LVTGCAAVFIGTLYPLILDAISGEKVSIGPPFFESSFVWIMVPLFILTAAGPLMAWKRADLPGVTQRLILAFAAAAVAAILLVAIKGGPWGAILGLTIAAWLIGGVVAEFTERLRLFRVPLRDSLRRVRVLPRSAWGMSLAHAGVAILIAGGVGATNWQTESIQVMEIGETVEVAGYDFTFVSLSDSQGPNYDRRRAEFFVDQDDERIATLHPEKRKYWVQGMDTTEAAIRTTWIADIYVAIGDPAPAGGTAVRIYHNPLVPWIWIGAVVMVAGGLISLSDRRHRVGAPSRARRAAPTAPAAPAAPAAERQSEA